VTGGQALAPLRTAPLDEIADRYPRLVAYLSGLADGLGSYPECLVRSGLVDAIVEAAPEISEPTPPFVEALLSRPARPWTSEVVLQATLLAIGDRSRMSARAFQEWTREMNREVYRSPVYRALMAFFSPVTLLDRGAARWASFRRGSALEVERHGDRGADLRLSFPPRVFTGELLESFAGAFAVALEHSRAKQASVELRSSTATAAAFFARWE
jgi:hypothetical protein